MNYRELIKSVSSNLLALPNVVSVGYGFKTINGKTTATPSIVCGVETKVNGRDLSDKEMVPHKMGDLYTDVVQVGEISAVRTDRQRPAPGGVSIGHYNITAGTLGCLVKRGKDVFILSNNHVLADSNEGIMGDPILQPGPFDGGESPADMIATLEDWVEIDFGGTSWGPFDFLRRLLCQFFGLFCGESSTNFVDAAIARPINPGDVSEEILDIGFLSGIAEGSILDLEVQKSGRTTGFTTSRVLQIGATVDVQYGDGLVARFEDQIIAGPMSEGGDSGSAVVNEHNELIGLLFAGSSSVTIINRIQHVFDILDVEL